MNEETKSNEQLLNAIPSAESEHSPNRVPPSMEEEIGDCGSDYGNLSCGANFRHTDSF